MENFTLEKLEEAIKDFYTPVERNISIRTGRGGMDLFEIQMEIHNGYERVYLGKKVSRILRKVKGIKKDASEREYRLVKIKDYGKVLLDN